MLSGHQIPSSSSSSALHDGIPVASIIGRRRCCQLGSSSSLLLLLTTTITVVAGLLIVGNVRCSEGDGTIVSNEKEAAPPAKQREFKLDEDALSSQENIWATKHPVFLSELRLRSIVEQANTDLRQLKRAYIEDMTEIYLPMKLDPTLGFEVARLGSTPAASALMLVAEEFGDIVKRKYVTQRRLLTGIKLAYVKFLPMNTLVRLYKRYKSFAWLKDQTQVDLRPKFPNARGKWRLLLTETRLCGCS